jgi:hypothetical protein
MVFFEFEFTIFIFTTAIEGFENCILVFFNSSIVAKAEFGKKLQIGWIFG